MKTVKDISSILNISEEQVRRWLRTGEIISTTPYSKKQGWVVTEEEFEKFLLGHSKYYRRVYGVKEKTVKPSSDTIINEIKNSMCIIKKELNKIQTLLDLLEERP